MLSVTDFVPKWIISGVRVQAGLYLDMPDADRSPNAVSVHAGTSQVDFEVDSPPPAACPPGDRLITMVKETVNLYKKEFWKLKKKSYLSLIWKRWNAKWLRDCLWLCQACKLAKRRIFSCIDTTNDFQIKRANVVLHVGLCKEIFARKHTATHKPTSAQPLIVTTMTHIHALIACGAP